jgi:putative transcriptional regulator
VNLHHPFDDTLARYAAGRLGAGPSLVVATHLTGCRECRVRVGLFEATGGALLAETPAERVAPEMFAANLARLDAPAGGRPPPPARRGSEFPAPLDQIEMPPWRQVGRGFEWRRLTLPYARDANVIMLKVAPGRNIPQHTHSGVEYTQVLKGSFHDELGRYVTGDCVEADEDVDHQPIVDSEEECICLAAVEGRLLLQGWIGRVVQRLIGI